LFFVFLLFFDYVVIYMYEGDMFNVEWCVAVLVFDWDLLLEFFGADEFCELINFEVLEEVECLF